MNKSNQAGVGLIEVLITVLVLSTALMALAALQTRSLQYNSSAYLRSQANIIAYDIIDRIRVSSPGSGAVATLDDSEINSLVSVLPEGTGSVECAARECTISVSWTEPTANKSGDALEKTTFSYTTRI